jgi:hypothetical protein
MLAATAIDISRGVDGRAAGRSLPRTRSGAGWTGSDRGISTLGCAGAGLLFRVIDFLAGTKVCFLLYQKIRTGNHSGHWPRQVIRIDFS